MLAAGNGVGRCEIMAERPPAANRPRARRVHYNVWTSIFLEQPWV
jgi:hypothetical protein